MSKSSCKRLNCFYTHNKKNNMIPADGLLPVDMQNVFDPIGLLTFVAANTHKIALGTSVVDMLFHTPVILGRRFATLDVLSEENR